jgi:hypothetical protein
LHVGHAAVNAATQDLRLSGQRPSQNSRDRGACEKMICLHGRLLLRPRSFRNLSEEYYEWAGTKLPSSFQFFLS